MYPRILFILLFPLIGLSQAPNKINFQSVIRNNLGEVQSNKSVSLRVSILSNSINGTAVFSESHTKTTDANGLISLQIGNGTVLSGVFANIDWGSAPHFIKLEIDFSGGSNFVLLGSQELMSVPYALYATKTDTSSLNLVNRLNAKVNISDTSSMLANYRTGLNQKVNISDTASMLNNYLRTGIATNTYQTKLTNPIVAADTSSMLANYRNGLNDKVNIADTASMLANYRTGINYKVNISDTASMLSNYRTGINAKVNISDTANMLSNYRTGLNQKVNIADTANMLSNYRTGLNYKVNISDTASMLSNYRTGINAKVNVSDTSSMLANYRTGLNNKVNIADTSNMLNPYLRKADAISSMETDPVFNTSIAKGITGIDTAYWNRKLNISDTSSMLSNYRNGLNDKVNIADTASMLNNYLRTGIAANTYQTKLTNPIVAADTANMLNPYLRKSDFPQGTTLGNMQYWNGTNWVNLAPGLPGQVISMSLSGIPSWSGPAYATLTTNAVASITPTSASVGGNISADGGASVTARGIVYGTSANPTLSNSVLSIGSGTGSYSGFITGLTPNTIYYFRAYATNTAGTNYGNEVSFQTLPVAVPTLNTTDASGITQTTVTSGGTISSDGGATVTERGIVYGTSSNPTTSNTKISSGSGTGSFSVNVTSLNPNTTYYIRSYAINSAGTGYGNNITFQTTVPAVPSLTTREILNITNTTATSGGSITNDGGSAISAKGVCWSTSPNPTISDSKTSDGTGTATFSSFLVSLSAGVTYYVRAYATNTTGTGYGNQQTFTTSLSSNTLPVITTISVTGITTILATINGEVNSQGGGTVTERGAVWSTSGNPTVNNNRVASGSGTGSYSVNLTGLTGGGNNYYVRAYAINNYGIAYGAELTFTTLFGLATLTTNNVITQSTTASSGGNITDAGGSTITARGVVWGTTSGPTIAGNKTTDGTGTGSFESNLTGLTPSTTYYLRAYATNNTGTSYGSEIIFTTTATPITDIDGNTYSSIQIGTQVWMSENLKTTRYRQGGPIPYLVGNSDWQALTTGAWSYYNHDVANNVVYGKLYNWYTTQGDTLCPTGWNVPSNSEWTTLTNYLGGESVAGGKMKSIGTTYWNSPNTGATNESGYSALPGGYRNADGSFVAISSNAIFWSKSDYIDNNGWNRNLDFRDGSSIFRDGVGNKRLGFSIRCLKTNIPTITTSSISSILSTTSTSGGNISSDGGESVTERGVVWSTSPNPSISLLTKTSNGTGTGTFVSNLGGLSPNTTYYVRAYATNNIGTGYGNQQIFTTVNSQVISDIDGNYYNTVQIGTQVWMSENLKTTRYRGGESASWRYYNNDATNNNLFGKLYDGWTALDIKGICPTGWHVPSDSEWTILTNYLGGSNVAGGKMKSVGTAYWNSPNTGATDESGFAALPGGFHNHIVAFNYINSQAYFWSSSGLAANTAWFRVLDFNTGIISRYGDNNGFGLSIRCIKN
jgi:uncharacterized protein (TIGR02145 family)